MRKKLYSRVIIVLVIIFSLLMIKTVVMPRNYNLEDSIEKGNVVNLHGEIYNLEKLEHFIDSVNNGENDKVLIIEYTIEGDQLVTKLNYKNDKIYLEYDTRRDRHGVWTVYKEQYKSIRTYIESTEDPFDLKQYEVSNGTKKRIILSEAIWNNN